MEGQASNAAAKIFCVPHTSKKYGYDLIVKLKYMTKTKMNSMSFVHMKT
jgi:hypothetical protein